MRILASIVVSLAAVMLPSEVWANCGLGSCPVVPAEASGKNGMLRMPIRSEVTAFDFADQSGTYTRTQLGLEVWGRDSIVISGALPVIALSRDDEATKVGLANPLANVQIVTRPVSWLTVAGGLMLEMPLGDDDLVDDHFVTLKHFQARVQAGLLEVRGYGGYLRAFGASHGEAHDHHHGHDHGHGHGGGPASPIDPHGDQELRGRASLGLALGRFAPGMMWDAAVELKDQGLSEQYHSVGGVLESSVGQDAYAHLQVLVPVSDAERYAWQAGLGLTLRR